MVFIIVHSAQPDFGICLSFENLVSHVCIQKCNSSNYTQDFILKTYRSVESRTSYLSAFVTFGRSGCVARDPTCIYFCVSVYRQ